VSYLPLAVDGKLLIEAMQARRKWCQYKFFTKRIDDSMANGMTALQAIHELDDLRGSRTLPQLHRELQPKGRKKKFHSNCRIFKF
jgi:hypothetical protein